MCLEFAAHDKPAKQPRSFPLVLFLTSILNFRATGGGKTNIFHLVRKKIYFILIKNIFHPEGK